jgi:hypothetical protein
MGRAPDSDEARYEKARAAADAVRAHLEDSDPYMAEHSVRVAGWCGLLARNIPGFSRSRQRVLEVTALLHDFGMTLVDPAIARKEGALEDDERRQIERHPELGAQNAPGPDDFVDRDAIRWHHKHFDGGGYPEGPLRGLDIPLEARILGLAEAFDALTHPRAWRTGRSSWPASDAIELMKELAGTELDPGLVALFDRVYELECDRVGGKVGALTLQVQSVIGVEVGRGRDLLRQEIGPFDPKDPLKGRAADDRLVRKLAGGLVGPGLDERSAVNVARHVLRLPLDETFPPGDLLEPPRKASAPPGGFAHHLEVVLRLRRVPPEAAYMRIVVFMGQLWLSVGERREDAFEIRLAR